MPSTQLARHRSGGGAHAHAVRHVLHRELAFGSGTRRRQLDVLFWGASGSLCLGRVREGIGFFGFGPWMQVVITLSSTRGGAASVVPRRGRIASELDWCSFFL